MNLVYVGCPPAEKAETEKVLASVRLSVLWADTAQAVVAELNRKDVPVLLDLSKGAAVLQMARDIRSQIAHALLFAVV
ncbi:MAG: hypothetical protein JF610_17645, partial [Acidobacteria bacterium]|nr:hypothetical protein [Acidobacteriota bacterium]